MRLEMGGGIQGQLLEGRWRLAAPPASDPLKGDLSVVGRREGKQLA
jgi:hypothetical protein